MTLPSPPYTPETLPGGISCLRTTIEKANWMAGDAISMESESVAQKAGAQTNKAEPGGRRQAGNVRQSIKNP